MRIPFARLAFATAILAAAGCGSDSTAPDMSHVGDYDLVSIDGDPIPATVIDVPGYKLVVTQGDLSLAPNSTFVQSITSVETIDGTEGPLDAVACTGRYTRKGSTITMTTPETDICFGQTVTGILSGTTLTLDYDGTSIVFRR